MVFGENGTPQIFFEGDPGARPRVRPPRGPSSSCDRTQARKQLERPGPTPVRWRPPSESPSSSGRGALRSPDYWTPRKQREDNDMFRRTLWIASAALCVATAAVAGADVRLKRALDDSGLKYLIDNDDDALVEFDVGDNGEITVIAFSDTSSLDGYETRSVWALAYMGTDIPDAMIDDILKENASFKIGAWQVLKKGPVATVVFSCAIPADMGGDDFDTVVRAIVLAVDRFRDRYGSGGLVDLEALMDDDEE
jgi:hypothetical protein